MGRKKFHCLVRNFVRRQVQAACRSRLSGGKRIRRCCAVLPADLWNKRVRALVMGALVSGWTSPPQQILRSSRAQAGSGIALEPLARAKPARRFQSSNHAKACAIRIGMPTIAPKTVIESSAPVIQRPKCQSSDLTAG